jgi:hypothetical protein
MSTLDLPPTTPLPLEVRERVLRTVVAGTRLGARALAVAAAALVATLAVMIPVALTVDASGINPLSRPAPVPAPEVAVTTSPGR